MRKMRRIGAACMAVALIAGSVGSFAACQPKATQERDNTKTQLDISFFAGGYGDAWVKEAEAEFTEKISERKMEFDIRRHRAEQIKLKLVRQGNRISAAEKRELDEFSLYKTNFEREIKEIRNELKNDLEAYNISARRINIFLIPGALVVLAFLWGITRFLVRKGRTSKCRK